MACRDIAKVELLRDQLIMLRQLPSLHRLAALIILLCL
nr:MAG TPA: hypothetical protein [Caudoviricetes sp.]